MCLSCKNIIDNDIIFEAFNYLSLRWQVIIKYNIDFVIEEIINLFRNNLKIFLLNDYYLIKLKEYSKYYQLPIITF